MKRENIKSKIEELATNPSLGIDAIIDEIIKEAAVSDSPPDIWLDNEAYATAWRSATCLAESKMVPDDFRNDIGACMIALDLSQRCGINVLMLMQNMYIVHGRPGIEAKLVHALLNRSGLFTPVEWKWDGDGKWENTACSAFATRLSDGKMLEMSIDWNTAVSEGWVGKKNSKWKTMPKQMFMYRSLSWFVKHYCPEILLGMSTVDELQDMGQDMETPITERPVPVPVPEPEKPKPVSLCEIVPVPAEPEQELTEEQAEHLALDKELDSLPISEREEVRASLENGDFLKSLEGKREWIEATRELIESRNEKF